MDKPILDSEWPYTKHKKSAPAIKETPHEETVRLLNAMMQAEAIGRETSQDREEIEL